MLERITTAPVGVCRPLRCFAVNHFVQDMHNLCGTNAVCRSFLPDCDSDCARQAETSQHKKREDKRRAVVAVDVRRQKCLEPIYLREGCTPSAQSIYGWPFRSRPRTHAAGLARTGR